MTHDLSVEELENEQCVELPTRTLLRRRRHHGGGASASFGSAANANRTTQINFNPQIVINNGKVDGGGIDINSHNTNDNDNTQTATPLNFGIGN
jgi:hypothetical protein